MSELQKYKMRKARRAATAGSKLEQKRMQREADEKAEEEAEVLNIKQTSDVVVSGVERNTISQSVTTPDNALSSSGQVDIELKSSVISTVKGQTMTLVNKNTSGASLLLPANAFDQIHHIVVKCNNGRNTIAMINKETLLYPLRFLDQETLALYRQGFLSNSGEELAHNESRTYYLPLIGDIFALNELYLAGITGTITYEVFFDASAWAGTIPELSKLNIITRHQKFGDAGERQMMERYQEMAQEFRYRELIEMKFNETLLPNDEYEFILGQFKSEGSELYVQIFQTGDNIEEFQQHIQSYNLTDSDNQSLISTQAIDADYHKIILNAAHDISNVLDPATSDPWLVIPLSSDSADDYKNGAMNGFHQFEGKETLKLTTKSTLVGGAYTIRVYYAKIKTMTITGGVISVR